MSNASIVPDDTMEAFCISVFHPFFLIVDIPFLC